MMDLRYAFILRGIPGSGKSTVARWILNGALSHWMDTSAAIIHSTDDLCMVDGEYRYDPLLAPERHVQNLANFVESLESKIPCVIVDNTNVKVQYYEPYLRAAQEHGYTPVIVEMAHPPLEVAVERNTHGVPYEIINQMILDWEPAQHCVTVEKVNEACEIVTTLQTRTRNYVLIGIGIGMVLGIVISRISTWVFMASLAG